MRRRLAGLAAAEPLPQRLHRQLGAGTLRELGHHQRHAARCQGLPPVVQEVEDLPPLAGERFEGLAQFRVEGHPLVLGSLHELGRRRGPGAARPVRRVRAAAGGEKRQRLCLRRGGRAGTSRGVAGEKRVLAAADAKVQWGDRGGPWLLGKSDRAVGPAARRGYPREWTWANATARSCGLPGPSADGLWAARAPIAPEERHPGFLPFNVLAGGPGTLAWS